MVPGDQKCTSFCFDRLLCDEKSAAPGAKKGRFCMGILVTLGLSTGLAEAESRPPVTACVRERRVTLGLSTQKMRLGPGKIFLLIRWPQSTRRNLHL